MNKINIIREIRNSFQDATIIYTHGACYGLYKILKSIFPKAQAYMTEDRQHIITKIDEKFYDISGEYIDLDGEVREKLIKLTKKQHEYWETVSSGQRIEYIIKKYNKN